MTPTPSPTSDDRIQSGIAGLDAIMMGGFLRGGITIVQGRPGSGKTIFGNQLCFNHARAGGKALFVTLLAESHTRMLMHIGGLSFFDPSLMPGGIYYLSAFPVLEAGGIAGLLTMLRQEVHRHQATLLVLDGLVTAEHTAGSDMAYKKFIHGLQAQATVADCAMFLLTSSGADADMVTAEHTMVDCVIAMRSQLQGWRSARHLEVLKRRGGDYLHGRHAFCISGSGVVVHPRTEAVLRLPSQDVAAFRPALQTGLAELDAMMGGGLPSGSATLLLGPAGTGKTTLGLHFLGACQADEPGLHVSFYENDRALRAKAAAFGLPVAALLASGQVSTQWTPLTGSSVDEACARLMDAVRANGVRRLVVDGLGGLVRMTSDPDRVVHIFAALANELRSLGVCSLFTTETEDLIVTEGPASALPPASVMSIAENVILLRYLPVRSELVRLLSVLKVRDAKVDTRMHVFEMTGRGLILDAVPDRAEAALAELDISVPRRRAGKVRTSRAG